MWIQAFLWLSVVYADYTVTVDLKSYENPTHKRVQSKDCCDGTCNYCDNRFRFCFSDSTNITEYSVILEERFEELFIGCQIVTDLVEMNNDNITFGSKFGNTRNPLKFKGDIWPVSHNLPVHIHSVTTVHYMTLLLLFETKCIIYPCKNSVCTCLHLNIHLHMSLVGYSKSAGSCDWCRFTDFRWHSRLHCHSHPTTVVETLQQYRRVFRFEWVWTSEDPLQSGLWFKFLWRRWDKTLK